MTSPWNQWPASGTPQPGFCSDSKPRSLSDRHVARITTSANLPLENPAQHHPPSSLAPRRESLHSSHASTPSPLEWHSPTFLPNYNFPRPPGTGPRRAQYDFRGSPTQRSALINEHSDAALSKDAGVQTQGLILGNAGNYVPATVPRLLDHEASPSRVESMIPNARPSWPTPPPSVRGPQTGDPQTSRQQSKSVTVRSLLNDDMTPRELRYDLCLRQQPANARSCGLGDRDRRVIDPPPILQLKIDAPWLSGQEISRKLRTPSYVVHCSIWSPDGKEDMSGMPDDYTRQKRLMGNLVASPFVGFDERGEEGCFFCFPDISCRTPGRYRLKFVLVVLEWPLRPNAKSMIRAELLSDVFQTYSAKEFPGMLESSALAKALKHQGCNIPTKKGNDRAGKRDDSEEYSGWEGSPRKRARNDSM
jgi:hypothetical protein